MLKLNIHEAKTHLSRYLVRLSRGESILLCKRNVPIAEIRPLTQLSKRKRAIGLAKGEFTISSSFFKPLPKELEGMFSGKNS